MSTLEDRLRDAFAADADLVRPESIPAAPPARPARAAPGRPGSRRARVLIPLASAAAVIAIVTSLSLAAPQLLPGARPGPGPANSGPTGLFAPTPGGSSASPGVLRPVPMPVLAADASRGVPSSAPAPGVPRFYVTVYNAPAGPVNYIVVRDTTAGQVVATITPPAGHFFAGMAATAGDRTFVTAVEPNSGCTSQLYWFQLNRQGRPGPLVPLHVTVPGTYSETGDLAITPDGGTIGYATYLCDAEGEVGVIHLATRQVRTWSEDFSPPNVSVSPIGLSLSADGRLLGFTTFAGTRVLQTSAPAGPLAARSQLVSGNVIWAALAADGDALYGCAVSPYRSGGLIPSVGTLTYGLIPLTGGGSKVIASWPGVTGPQCYASLDPAGNYLLVQFPTIANGVDDWSRPAILDLRTGKLTEINAPAFYGPFDIAW
jgi:hypothetical protein